MASNSIDANVTKKYRCRTLNIHEMSGTLYVVAAPSGAGKTSLVNALLQSIDNLQVSISYTTRKPRPGEQDGVEYRFVSHEQFQHMVHDKQFLEYAEVYGEFYGTSHRWVIEALEKGLDVILEIDWQGARQIRHLFSSAVSIFVLPPSQEVLRQRLERRRQDSPEVIDARMQVAREEIQHYKEFDYLVVNDDFGVALSDLKKIIRAQRLRCPYQGKKLEDLLAELLKTE